MPRGTHVAASKRRARSDLQYQSHGLWLRAVLLRCDKYTVPVVALPTS
jgi:hypothetical protein